MNWDEFFNKKYGLENYLACLWAHSELFEEIIKENPKTILEAGTGRGIMSIFLSWLGYKITAVDNNQALLERSRNLCKQLNGNVSYIFCDAFKLENCFFGQKFDLVFSQGFLEHFDDKQIRMLIRQQLKVANKIIISVPSVFYPLRDFGNERLLSVNKWKIILKDFDIERIRYYGFAPSKDILKRSFTNPFIFSKVIFNILFKRSQIIIIIK